MCFMFSHADETLRIIGLCKVWAFVKSVQWQLTHLYMKGIFIKLPN